LSLSDKQINFKKYHQFIVNPKFFCSIFQYSVQLLLSGISRKFSECLPNCTCVETEYYRKTETPIYCPSLAAVRLGDLVVQEKE